MQSVWRVSLFWSLRIALITMPKTSCWQGVSAPLKRRLGKAAYVWRSLIETRRYKPVRYAVEVDGVRYEVASVIVTRFQLVRI